MAKNIIFNLRLPRLLAALLTMSLPQLVQRESTIVLVLAGGKNARPEAKNLAVISLEEIIRVNPQVIIGSSGNRSFEAIRKIKDSPEWARIDAVKNPRIYANPMGTFPWDRYSTEAALQILWAAQLFHPEKFKDIDLVARTQAFYRKYDNFKLSADPAQRLISGDRPAE